MSEHDLTLKPDITADLTGMTGHVKIPVPRFQAIQRTITGLQENGDRLRSEVASLTSQLGEARGAAIEECAKIAESEPELPGEPEPHVLAAMVEVGPIRNARIAVRTTKECIAERIRALAAIKVPKEAA